MNAMDRLVAMASAVATPVVTLLVAYHATTPEQGAAIGGVIAALAVGYHAGTYTNKSGGKSNASTAPANTPQGG